MYTVDYFIKKFEAVPDNKWITNNYETDTGCCALGHCGARADTDSASEAVALKKLFSPFGKYAVQYINDRQIFFDKKYAKQEIIKYFDYPTPKQRILAALHDIKKMQQPPQPEVPKEKIRYVSVPASITEQTKELILQ